MRSVRYSSTYALDGENEGQSVNSVATPLITYSSSGTPYTTPAGHTPPWVHRVSWHKASAFEPEQYSQIIQNQTAVVHCLGILLEDAGYKKAVKDGNIFGVAKAIGGSLFGSSPPLKGKEESRRGYEGMNRDSGECVELFDGYFESL